MIGTIIGDIAGSIYEFNNTFNYDFPLFSAEGDFTDDTVCAMATADALLNHGGDHRAAMLDWCRRYPNPMGAYGSNFSRWIAESNPQPYGSYGNGSAMRVAPVAWLLTDEDSVKREAQRSAAITHNHPEGIRGAVATAVAIFRMRNAVEKSPAIFKDVAREFYGPGAFDHLPPRGYFDVTCQGCVPLSLLIAADATSFEDAIRRAVSHGGDTDTVGAIVGSLAEARFGVPAEMAAIAKSYLPNEMLTLLDQFENERLRRN